MALGDVLQRESKIKSPVPIKEEPVLSPPESSSNAEAPQSMKKGPWSAEEDAILTNYVKRHGEGNWNAIQKNTGLQRCGKSCRLRWANHLRPNLKKESFSQEEENHIIRLHAQFGNKWARMAAQLPGRTDNEIKNYWNTRVKRRQRSGLPLYPPEIQSQVAFVNKRQSALITQNQVPPKDFISHNSPTMTTLFKSRNVGNDEKNCLLGIFDLRQSCQQFQSSTFLIKMKRPSSTELYPRCTSDQMVTPQPTPLGMGQANRALQESQGPGELFKEKLLFDHLSTNGTTMVEPLPSSMPPTPSNTKHSSIDPLYELSNSNISIGLPATEQSDETMINQNVSNLLETKLIHTTPMPTSELCDSPSPMPTDDNLRIDMQRMVSNFSMTNEWKFESKPWPIKANSHTQCIRETQIQDLLDGSQSTNQ